MTALEVARNVLAAFDFPARATVEWFAQRGNINLDAFLVVAPTADGPRRALLQRINTEVFALPERVMSNMEAVLAAQLAAETADSWIVPNLVPTRAGTFGVREASGTWRMMVLIENVRSVKSLSLLDRPGQLSTAREAGRGLARYLDATAAVDAARLRSSLPGYRDGRMYLAQWRCAIEGSRFPETYLPEDAETRESCRPHFAVRLPEAEWRRRREQVGRAIDVVEANEPFLTLLADERSAGRIADRAVHGDPKIENFLFHEDGSGEVAALVDLDTVMPHTWLVDWGDMARSLSNVAGEKERDPDRIAVDSQIYAACAEGFLGEIRSATDHEIALMPRASAAMSLELAIRFLSDYLRGDTYFVLGPADAPDLNLVRGMAQIVLFERLVEHAPEAEEIVARAYTPVSAT